MLVGAYPFEDPEEPKNLRKTIATSMNPEEDKKGELHLRSNYLETFNQVKVKEKDFTDISVDLLAGMREMLAMDQLALFHGGGCFVYVVSLLNGVLPTLSGEKLVDASVMVTSAILVKAGLISWPPETGKGKGKILKHITHGFNMVKGNTGHAMEDYLVSDIKQIDDNELGLFAIFDGHAGHKVANYLQNHLFDNILQEEEFWENAEAAIKSAYHKTDIEVLEKSVDLGNGGSTAVTAILINGCKLVVANVGDSRAVICRNGVAEQLSVDHEPSTEKEEIVRRGGFVSNIPGDVARVDGQLAVARAFGDKRLKIHMSSDPDIQTKLVDEYTEFLILASDGLWKVISNEEAVGLIRNIKNPQSAAIRLTDEAVLRKSTDDISCIVVRFLQ